MRLNGGFAPRHVVRGQPDVLRIVVAAGVLQRLGEALEDRRVPGVDCDRATQRVELFAVPSLRTERQRQAVMEARIVRTDRDGRALRRDVFAARNTASDHRSEERHLRQPIPPSSHHGSDANARNAQRAVIQETSRSASSGPTSSCKKCPAPRSVWCG